MTDRETIGAKVAMMLLVAASQRGSNRAKRREERLKEQLERRDHEEPEEGK